VPHPHDTRVQGCPVPQKRDTLDERALSVLPSIGKLGRSEGEIGVPDLGSGLVAVISFASLGLAYLIHVNRSRDEDD
jgi:hypothetical protein